VAEVLPFEKIPELVVGFLNVADGVVFQYLLPAAMEV
jgi:hypothetical protein